MNDYWNNPPDDQEPPEWYMTLEDILEQQEPPELVATAIRKAMDDWAQDYNDQHDIAPEPEMTHDEPDIIESDICPHDNQWGDCGACDYASDVAFDTAREQRFFRS
jgi:hypothetical protein